MLFNRLITYCIKIMKIISYSHAIGWQKALRVSQYGPCLVIAALSTLCKLAALGQHMRC